jgi:hypothetical protein
MIRIEPTIAEIQTLAARRNVQDGFHSGAAVSSWEAQAGGSSITNVAPPPGSDVRSSRPPIRLASSRPM